MIRIPYELALSEMEAGLRKFLPEETARQFAGVFAENSLEGIYSHGMNRYPRYLSDMENGICDARVTEPERIGGIGGLEVWDAHFGIGPLIADKMANRAVELARENGISCCALRNNSHWLRAGRYALAMARENMYAMCLTNTCMNLTAWGAKEHSTGNNPIAMAIPGDPPILMDMAVSQYAYGKLEIMAQEGQKLDQPCGYNDNGEMTTDPGEIVKSSLMLPMGMWKGSALSMMIDFLTSGISQGRSSRQIGEPIEGEKGMSQLFIAIDADKVSDQEKARQTRNETIDFFHHLKTAAEGGVHVPGEGLPKTRAKNLEKGIPVTEETWEKITKAARGA